MVKFSLQVFTQLLWVMCYGFCLVMKYESPCHRIQICLTCHPVARLGGDLSVFKAFDKLFVIQCRQEQLSGIHINRYGITFFTFPLHNLADNFWVRVGAQILGPLHSAITIWPNKETKRENSNRDISMMLFTLVITVIVKTYKKQNDPKKGDFSPLSDSMRLALFPFL